MNENPRPWFRFRLRTLFVLVAVASIPMAWVGYSLHWTRLRNAARNRPDVWVRGKLGYPPSGLWLFGEAYANYAFLQDDSEVEPPMTAEELQELFPEAVLFRVPKARWHKP
jgi:hypothetical protein